MGVQDNKALADLVGKELQLGALKHMIKTAQAEVRVAKEARQRAEEACKKAQAELEELKQVVSAHMIVCSQIILSQDNVISDTTSADVDKSLARLREVIPNYVAYDRIYRCDDYVY